MIHAIALTVTLIGLLTWAGFHLVRQYIHHAIHLPEPAPEPWQYNRHNLKLATDESYRLSSATNYEAPVELHDVLDLERSA